MNADTLLHPADYRVMPWRNGGGTTTELLIEPPGASLDSGFLWRLSMAEVGVSGPFSRFEGYDRTLLLLAGRGMCLEFQQRPSVRLESLLQPVRFSGDWLTSGTLLDGPCRDFNVITRRAACRHRLDVMHLESHPRQIFPARIRLVFCLTGAVQVNGLALAALDLLRVEHSARALTVASLTPSGAMILAIGIDPAEGLQQE